LFTAAFQKQAPQAVERVRQVLLATPPEGYVACCAAVRDMDQRETVARVQAPTLVVAGTHEQATPPADGKFLAERISGARYVELSAGHLGNIEAEAHFTDAVLGFLTG
jgi:3-oxoadipate enol-lactonase